MSDVDNYGRFRAASSVSMDSSFGDEFIGVASQNRIIDEVSFIILYSIRLPVIQVLYMLLIYAKHILGSTRHTFLSSRRNFNYVIDVDMPSSMQVCRKMSEAKVEELSKGERLDQVQEFLARNPRPELGALHSPPNIVYADASNTDADHQF